jgi:hypothetical protein
VPDRITVTLEGTEELKRRLLAMDAVSSENVLRPIVAEGARMVADVAVGLAPTLKRPHKGRTAGALRKGVRVEFLKAGVGYCHYVIGLLPEVWYGFLQEFGLGSGRLASKARLNVKTLKTHERYARRLEAARAQGRGPATMKNRYGQPHSMAAQPFIRPAFRFARESVVVSMLEKIAAVILDATE